MEEITYPKPKIKGKVVKEKRTYHLNPRLSNSLLKLQDMVKAIENNPKRTV